jgi:DNA-binding transcriptional regulator YdaS (Cro superfamily)
MTYPAMTTLTDRLAPFSRPAILEATRAIGLSDSELARLLEVTPGAVNDWVKGRRRIPPTKHLALMHFIAAMVGIFEGDLDPPNTVHARRAALLNDVIRNWMAMAIDEGAVAADTGDEARELAERMLAQLADTVAA